VEGDEEIVVEEADEVDVESTTSCLKRQKHRYMIGPNIAN
jgi:hypothetical protein